MNSSVVEDAGAGVGARLRVRLYVAGRSPNSVAATGALRALIAEFSARGIESEIIDVLLAPERALEDGVLITPMLVRVEPPPERRVLGNLSDRKALLVVLGLEDALHE